ncbi:MAG: adenosylcobinamide-GDP ribazoletransferase [Acidimicrobiia bacterium]
MRRAVAFLTPVGGAAAPSPAAVPWFPLVGALLGAAVGAVWWGADRLWPPAVAAALAVAADLVLTGALHADGLADTADGLLPPLDRERRLDVMADPRAGAFGVVAVVAVLLLRWAAFASWEPSVAAVAGVWCASRTVMAVALLTVHYARPGGLAGAFGGGAVRPVPVSAVGMAGAAALAAAGVGLGPGVAAVAAVAVGGMLVVALAVRRIGGYTGDVLGAAGLVGETAGLLVLAARW